MGLINPSLPTVGQPNSSEEPKIVTVESQLLALVNGNLEGVNLKTGSGIVDRWETVLDFQGNTGPTSLTTTIQVFNTQGVGVNSPASVGGLQGLWIPPSSGDIAVTGKTTRFRTRVVYAINATAPGITLNWGLYPVTVFAGGSSSITPTLGTVLSGSVASKASPALGTAEQITSTGFDLSAVTGGLAYVPGLVASAGTAAAASNTAFQFILEMTHT